MDQCDDTPRRYPRTLNEAFPQTAEYGAAITFYPGWWTRILRFFGLR